jgi:hypothetical protein
MWVLFLIALVSILSAFLWRRASFITRGMLGLLGVVFVLLGFLVGFTSTPPEETSSTQTTQPTQSVNPVEPTPPATPQRNTSELAILLGKIVENPKSLPSEFISDFEGKLENKQDALRYTLVSNGKTYETIYAWLRSDKETWMLVLTGKDYPSPETFAPAGAVREIESSSFGSSYAVKSGPLANTFLTYSGNPTDSILILSIARAVESQRTDLTKWADGGPGEGFFTQSPDKAPR